MNKLGLRLLLLVCFCGHSCEVPRSDPPKPSQPATPEARPAAPAPKAAQPQDQATTNRERTIDGREPRTAEITTPGVVIPIRVYQFLAPPADVVPQSAKIDVAPLSKPVQSPTVVAGTRVDRVVLDPARVEWESALLDRGLVVLDRTTLQSIQREHFIQQATATPAAVADMVRAAKNDEEPLFRSPIAGRSPYPVEEPLFWQQFADAYMPLVSGSAVAGDQRLPHGKIQAARWVLELGRVHFASSDLPADCMQPTAAAVSHVPLLVDLLPLPQLADGDWERSAESPFHFIQKDGTVYFDPEAGSLWTIEGVWIGPRVSRSDYILRHTEVTDVFCEECRKRRADRSTTKPPSPESTPLKWTCSTCSNTDHVVYLDGYRAPDLAPEASHAIISCRWIDPVPGLYPVLRATEESEGQRMSLRRHGVNLNEGELLGRCKPSALLGERAATWCFVGSDRSALVLGSKDLEALGQVVRALHAQAVHTPIPSTDDAGRQTFRLASEPYRKTQVIIPVQEASVDVRVVSAENSTVAVAGSLTLSYLNVMDSPVQISVTADGPNLNSWPNEVEQRRLLERTLRRTLAALLSP